MEVHRKTVQQPFKAEEVSTSEIVPPPGADMQESELRNLAICAIMEMDIQDVVKYLSYIRDRKI